MKPKAKIYLTHQDRSIWEIAKIYGVSKRRTKELIELAAEINRSMAPSKSGSNGKTRARKRSAPTAHN